MFVRMIPVCCEATPIGSAPQLYTPKKTASDSRLPFWKGADLRLLKSRVMPIRQKITLPTSKIPFENYIDRYIDLY